jgi:tRNA(Ile2) C34 agmatinyltransferase TiaS
LFYTSVLKKSSSNLKTIKIERVNKMTVEKFNPCRYCGDEGDHAGVCCKCEAKHEKERADYSEYLNQKKGL